MLYLSECFCAVAKHLSFNRAAAEMSVSVSVVSGNVKRLEQDLGVTLFHRTTRHVSLTHEGAALLPYAQDLLAGRSALHEAAARLRGGSAGLFLIADCPVLQPLLEPSLHDFLHDFPNIEPRSVSMLAREIPDAVRSGRVDIGMSTVPPVEAGDTDAAYPAHRSLCRTKLCTVTMNWLLVPVGHRFEELPTVTVHDLAEESILLPDREYHQDMHVEMLDFFDRSGVSPCYQYWSARSQFEMVSMVANGQGVAMVCDGLRFDSRAPVRLVPLSGPAPTMDVVVISRPDPRPIAVKFTEFIATHPLPAVERVGDRS